MMITISNSQYIFIMRSIEVLISKFPGRTSISKNRLNASIVSKEFDDNGESINIDERIQRSRNAVDITLTLSLRLFHLNHLPRATTRYLIALIKGIVTLLMFIQLGSVFF